MGTIFWGRDETYLCMYNVAYCWSFWREFRILLKRIVHMKFGVPQKNGAPTRVPFGGYTGWWYFSLSDKSLIGKGVS